MLHYNIKLWVSHSLSLVNTLRYKAHEFNGNKQLLACCLDRI